MFTVDLDKILGKGGFGTVFEGKLREKTVAVKRIKLSEIASNKREEDALQRLDHPNVIKLLHVESDSNYRYYVLELCRSSLDKLFLREDKPEKYRGPMPPKMAVLYQLAIGLEYIHSAGLFHRDIKPGNVLIWVNPANEQVLMKWADFGLSKSVNEKGTCSISEVRGTFDWMAPEILKLLDDGEATEAARQQEQRGTVQTDVFDEGLVFGSFLLDGLHPFGSPVKIAANILTNNPVNLPKIQPQYARELIGKMLAEQPNERITSSDVAQALNSRERVQRKVLTKEEQIELQAKLIRLCEHETYPSVDSIEILIEKGVDVNCVDQNGLTPFLHLINGKMTGGDNLLELLRLLIRNGVNLNCKDRHGQNALHLLCIFYKNENLIDIIRLLIEKGIDVNHKTKMENNALHLLCYFYKNKNLIDIIRLLMENGIDVNCKDEDGDNALTFLCRNYKNENLIDIIRLLMKKGIDVNCKNINGDNALYYLRSFYDKSNKDEIVKLLEQQMRSFRS